MKNISNNYNKYIFGATTPLNPSLPYTFLRPTPSVFLFVFGFLFVLGRVKNEGEKRNFPCCVEENGKFKLNWFVAVVSLQFTPALLRLLPSAFCLTAFFSTSSFYFIFCGFPFLVCQLFHTKINAYFNSISMWEMSCGQRLSCDL